MVDMENIPVAGYDRLELLQIADAVAREKSIEAEEVLIAMEMAIQKQPDPNTGLNTMFGQKSTARAATSSLLGISKWSTKSRTRLLR